MKRFSALLSLLTLVGCNSEVINDGQTNTTQNTDTQKVYTLPLNQFQSVWNEVKIDPLDLVKLTYIYMCLLRIYLRLL